MIKKNNAFKKSWRDLREHPRVFVPDVVFIMYAFLAGYLALYVSGMMSFAESLIGVDEVQAEALMRSFFQSSGMGVAVWLGLFVLVSFVVGAGLAAFKYQLVHDIVMKKKHGMRVVYQRSKAFFWRIVGVKIGVFILFVLVFALASLVFSLAYTGSPKAAFVAATIVGVMLAVLVILLSYMKFPVLYHRDKGAVQTLKESFMFFKCNKLFVLCIAVIVGFTLFVFRSLLGLLSYGLPALAALWSMLGLVVLVVAMTWPSVYMFNAYHANVRSRRR